MSLLLLLASTLLSTYLHPGRVADAQQLFTIRNITLFMEPSAEVTRDTSVTLRCKASVSSSGQEVLSREYTVYKDNQVVYTKTSSTTEDLLYRLPEARVSNSGKYMCKINITGTVMTSDAQKLLVTGLSEPVLRLSKTVLGEGEELTAWCTAPGETGSIFFYFYDGSKEILDKEVNSNRAEVKLRFSSVGVHRISCAYTVSVKPFSYESKKSNTLGVAVTELSIKPILEISPLYKIYEGDQLDISCTVSNFMNNTLLDLTHGLRILARGTTKINYSMIALAKDPGEFECILEIANVKKVAKKTISVTELFSAPTLTVSPAEVFQKEYMNLTCRSENVASERLGRDELLYTLDPNNTPLVHRVPGVFVGNALQTDFNYTCVAQAKGIIKRSDTVTVRPKVAVSTPKISVVGRAVLAQPFTIRCFSDNGTLPIKYTLLRDDKPLHTVSVVQHLHQALFSATIARPDEISRYKCEAKNSQREPLRSDPLHAPVVVPLTTPVLNVIPSLPEISEGDNLILICGTNGTTPVTFKWYHEGNGRPLHTVTSNENSSSFQIPALSKTHSGRYYCEAVNHANRNVRSNWVNIEVRLALWKKVLIGGSCLLAVSLLAVACVLYFKSRRGRKEAAAELSVKPSSPKSDDSLTVNLTHGTEVYNAATVKVDRAVVSVWSKRPPEDANDEESSVVSSEPDVEYTEVVHPRPTDPARVPLRKGTDTVYSELQNSPHGAADHHDYKGSVEYADLNGEQPEIPHYHPEVNSYQDLPEPVD